MFDTIKVNNKTLPWLFIERGFQIPSFNFSYDTEDVPGRPGSVKKRKNLKSYSFELPLIVRNDYLAKGGIKNHDEVLNELVKFFNYDEDVKLQFSSKNWYWNASFEGPIDLPNSSQTFIQTSIKVLLTDPYKYADKGSQNTAISDQISVVNSGTAEAPILVEARALKNSNYFMITKGDEDYFMIGDDDVTKEVKNYSPPLLSTELTSLSGWVNQNAGEIKDSVFGGTIGGNYKMNKTNASFEVDTYGNPPRWGGPCYKRAFPRTAQNFMHEGKFIIYQRDGGAGFVAHHLYDENNRLFLSMGYQNRYNDVKKGSIIISLFKESGEQVRIFEFMCPYIAAKFSKLTVYIRIMRIGKDFIIKTWMHDEANDYHRTKPLYITNKTYRDEGNFFQRKISAVSLMTARHSNYKPMPMSQVGSFTFEKLDKPKNAIDMIIKKGDLIVIDMAENNVVVNGSPFVQHKTFGSDYFDIKKGLTELLVYPNNTFDTTVKWQDRFL